MTGDGDYQAELRALREDNEALRYSSLKFGELSERLAGRVRELERRLHLYQRSCVESRLGLAGTPQRDSAKTLKAGGVRQ